MLLSAISACSVQGRVREGCCGFSLPCCGRKPAKQWHPEHCNKHRAKLLPWGPCGTGSLLRVPWVLQSPCTPCTVHPPAPQAPALPAPCATHSTVGTLPHTLQHTHPAAHTHPGHRHCPSTPRGNTYLGSAAMPGSGDRTMGWDMTAPSMPSSYPSPCAPRLGAISPPQHKQLTDAPHCSPKVATPLLAPHELLPVLGVQQGPGLQCHPSAEGTFLPQAGASLCPSSPSPVLAGLPFDRHVNLFQFLWLPISVLCLLGQPKTE